MKLGSLFDGSGTCPLAAAMCGIEPMWASEIEPYPIRVTKKNFPGMKHLGDVTKIKGNEIEPVDVITFGSPCQDMSVAGNRAGIKDGKRSSLFFEAIRIIKEMRAETNGRYPTFAVWENVPGAFSSNKGRDFLAVLQAFAKAARGAGADVPEPAEKQGKLQWSKAGCIMGDGWSVAWRMLDAQYWGVPQRRKRIYLVADFAGGRAPEILFKREGLPGNTEACGAARERTAEDPAGSAGRSGSARCLNPQVVYALQGNGIDRAETAGCNGRGWREDVCYTLNTIDRPAVCYDARGNGDGTHCPTITGDHENRITDYTTVCVMQHGQSNGEIAEKMVPTLNCNHEQPIAAYSVDCRNATLDEKKPRKWIIRRLTPLECCRLQGFPDWWEEGVEGSDTARYKMWGNGMALPCVLYVMQGIAEAMGGEKHDDGNCAAGGADRGGNRYAGKRLCNCF